MEKIFNWEVKERPEDFIVSEVASFPIKDTGKYFLYRLVKRNLNTNDLAKLLGFRYAGLKDRVAITFQYVLFKKFQGEALFEKLDKESFYGLTFLGKTDTKISIGFLKGNKFSIKIKVPIEEKDFFINYFDLQRIDKNWERGFNLFISDKSGKRFSWLERFLVDSFLSFLWNKGLEFLIRENFDGYFIFDREYGFFIPKTDFKYLFNNFPKFFPILGYKVKLADYEEKIYRDILKDFGLTLEIATERLRDIKIKGDYRKTFLRPEDIYIKGDRIYFFIPKGAYATMYLKHIFK